MMDALAKGDEVVTVGGILGRVSKVNDTYITIEIAANTEVVVLPLEDKTKVEQNKAYCQNFSKPQLLRLFMCRIFNFASEAVHNQQELLIVAHDNEQGLLQGGAGGRGRA